MAWYWQLLVTLLVLIVVLTVAAGLIWYERRLLSLVQDRYGPNRVGPYGLLTPIADAVKLIFKEIIRPSAANKPLFFLGPVMTMMPTLAGWLRRLAARASL